MSLLEAYLVNLKINACAPEWLKEKNMENTKFWEG